MIEQAMRPTRVPPPPALVTDVRVRNWASELVLVCLDDPLTRRPFELVFTNCREIRWSLDDAASNGADAAEADVIGLRWGQAGLVEPAIVTTDLFELSILYDRLQIREATDDSAPGRRELAGTTG